MLIVFGNVKKNAEQLTQLILH